MAIITTGANAKSRIGYKNLFTTSGVTVTASDEASGFPKENAYDWLSYDWWKQSALGTSWLRASFVSAKPADYMAIFGHNLSDVGGTVTPQYSTDSGSTWNDAASGVAPISNKTMFFGFDSVSAADWRCEVVTTTGQAYCAGVMIGEAMVFERGIGPGFAVPSMDIETKLKTYKSELGVFIGGSKVREGISGSVKLTNLTPSWVRSDWLPFLDHARTPRPFIFAWDYVGHPNEIVFAYAKDGKIPAPSYQDVTYMAATINMTGTE